MYPCSVLSGHFKFQLRPTKLRHILSRFLISARCCARRARRVDLHPVSIARETSNSFPNSKGVQLVLYSSRLETLATILFSSLAYTSYKLVFHLLVHAYRSRQSIYTGSRSPAEASPTAREANHTTNAYDSGYIVSVPRISIEGLDFLCNLQFLGVSIFT